MSKRRIVFGILTIIMMIIIFCFSQRDGRESEDQSINVGLAVGNVVVKDFKEMPKPEQLGFARRIDYYVRKSAHFLEFMTLGMLLAESFADKKRKYFLTMLIAWIIGTLYAVTDEIHQIFVPGRACQVFDVMIDSSGVLTGIIIVSIITGIALIIRRKLSKNIN